MEMRDCRSFVARKVSDGWVIDAMDECGRPHQLLGVYLSEKFAKLALCRLRAVYPPRPRSIGKVQIEILRGDRRSER